MSKNSLVMGIDVGSTSSKCVILRGGEMLAGAVVSSGAGTSGPARVKQQVLQQAGVTQADVAKTVATGYGRNHEADADENKSELSCHARAVGALCPGAHTVIDIGGQDAKVMQLDDAGRMVNFVMNDKCAAGTGRFLDVMARVLELDVSQLAQADAQSTARVDISSTCTVFAESEVVSHLAAAKNINDIVAGIHRSVAVRVAGLAGRVGVRPLVVMTGGVAQNAGVVRALQAELGEAITVLPNCQLAGAIGAAYYAEDLL